MRGKYILATQVHVTSYKDTSDRITIWARNKTSCYVVAANVHVVTLFCHSGQGKNELNLEKAYSVWLSSLICLQMNSFISTLLKPLFTAVPDFTLPKVTNEG